MPTSTPCRAMKRFAAARPSSCRRCNQARERSSEEPCSSSSRAGGPMRCRRNPRTLDGTSPRAATGRIAAIACISATSEELETISPTRCRIAGASVGTSSVAVGHKLHDDQVARDAAVDHRPQRRIAAIAAVPIRLAIDLHRLEQLRQACRGEQHIDSHRLVGNNARQACLDVGYRDEQRRRALAADRLDIDVGRDGIAQRIDAQWVGVVGRQRAGGQQPRAQVYCAKFAPRAPTRSRPRSATAGRAMRSQNERSDCSRPAPAFLAPARSQLWRR